MPFKRKTATLIAEHEQRLTELDGGVLTLDR
jgi:hypothetical protein